MMSESGKAVFLSYASQDAEAAKHICDALRAAGVEVWFDQNELVGGDAWDAKIRGQIKDCALFVPVISAATQARLEGYFRLEWKLAAQRTHTMADEKVFLLPVVIDDTRDADAKVPAEFKSVQWTRLPGGKTPPAFPQRVKQLLAGEGGSRAAESRVPMSGSPESGVPYRPARRWLAPLAAVTVVVALILVLTRPWESRQPSTGKVPPAELATPAAPAKTSEAQKLVQQAQRIYQDSDELDRETLNLADDLVKRALALDASEPSAWLLAAQLSYLMVWQSFDETEIRKAELQRQAARARALAPDSVAARLVAANARLAMAFNNYDSVSNRQDLADVEKDLLQLAEQHPEDPQVQRALGQTNRFLRRPDRALTALQHALELSGGDPSIAGDVINVVLRRKRYAEAEALLAPALARRPIGRLLVFDVLIKLHWRGDLPAAQAALDTWPGWLLREDRGAFIAWQTWLWSRQPARALDVAQRLPRDYLHDVWFTGPRAVLTARAHELAGNREAALADWRTAVRLADRELAGAPDDAAALFWRTWALGRLGDQAGAESAATLLQQRMTTRTVFFKATNPALLWSTLGRVDRAVDQLRASANADDDAYAVTRAALEFEPAYESLRADPRYAALHESALAPTSATASEAGPKPDDKSVAVLAFTNLSDDKANEYFSDGVSEELLNVLAKVPGLKVAARTSAFYFKGKEVPVPEIAKQLGVAYVVEGSVRKAGDKVRITAQLIKASDGFHVWSDSFTRDIKDVFAVQDEIAGLIAENLALKLGRTAAASFDGVSPEAYQLFLEARQAVQRRTRESYDIAEALLQRAITLAPRFARAQAALGIVWELRSEIDERDMSFGTRDGENNRRIAAKIREALDLDTQVAEAHAARGLLAWNRWRFDEASSALEEAIRLNPNYASGHQWLGRVRANQGRLDESLASLQRAAELDPLAPRILDNYARPLAFAGRAREVLELAERALRVQPGAIQPISMKALAQADLGDADGAVATLRELPANESLVAYFFPLVLSHAGRTAEIERLLRDNALSGFFARFTALVALGRIDEAMALFDADQVNSNKLDFLLFDRVYDPIREHPKFVAALATMNITEIHARAQAWRRAHGLLK